MSEEKKASTTPEQPAEPTEQTAPSDEHVASTENAEPKDADSAAVTDPNDGKKYWLEQPGNVDKIVWALVAVCGLLVLADLFYHKHTHFSYEGWFGFYGFYGFIACVALVLAAKQMRKLLMREEDYYDR